MERLVSMTMPESKKFPGVIGALLDLGALPMDTPNLDVLLSRCPERAFFIDGNRLDRKGWSLRNDVDLAVRAARKLSRLSAHAEDAVTLIERWLTGSGVSTGELRRAWHTAHARQQMMTRS